MGHLIIPFAILISPSLVSGVAIKVLKVSSEDLPAGKSLSGDYILAQESLSNVDENDKDLLCAAFCRRSKICAGFVVTDDDQCNAFVRMIQIEDASILTPTKSFLAEDTNKILVFRHDSTTSGFFPTQSSHGSWNMNENDPTADQYSILGNIEQFKDDDGLYLFEMCYPGITTVEEDDCFIFEQSSNPTSSGPVSDFMLYHAPLAYGNDCTPTPSCALHGLVADTTDKAWLDGNPGTTWCFSLGAIIQWSSATAGAFPGFCDANHPAKSVSAYVVELYVYAPN